MTDEKTRKILDEMVALSQELQKFKEEYEILNDAWWNGLSEREREDAFYAVCKRIHQGDLIDKGSYRYVLYDVFGFDAGMYGAGMDCGYMNIHNAIHPSYFKDQLSLFCERYKIDDYKNKVKEFLNE